MKRIVTGTPLVVLTVIALASAVAANCTQGFWKNHEENWCADALWLGDRQYSQAELASIFALEVAGNGLVSLAHQLIAAKLNAACGSVPAPEVPAADALIGSLVIPPVGGGYLDPSVTSALVNALTDYNELPGDSGGFGGCEPVAIESDSWGRVKATYR